MTASGTRTAGVAVAGTFATREVVNRRPRPSSRASNKRSQTCRTASRRASSGLQAVEAAAVLDRHGIRVAAAAALEAGAGVAPDAGGQTGARPRVAPTGRLPPRLRVALSCRRAAC